MIHVIKDIDHCIYQGYQRTIRIVRCDEEPAKHFSTDSDISRYIPGHPDYNPGPMMHVEDIPVELYIDETGNEIFFAVSEKAKDKMDFIFKEHKRLRAQILTLNTEINNKKICIEEAMREIERLNVELSNRTFWQLVKHIIFFWRD